MLFSKILVAYNDTDLSNKALETAIEIAKGSPETEIDILYAVQLPIPTYTSGIIIQETQDKLNEYAEETLEKAMSKLSGLPNTIHKHVVDKQPIPAILDHIENQKNDLIIMGNRGLSGIKEFFDSVSHVIVQKSPIPVLLVK
ncbi:universal stress protein [Heyndrickxia vini]|uniref:Universal stress protein n=1 Tax=Heyndrickxia vini TaxID=1476025 RepID=A0ABX7E0Q6_9BACI|nr:universal stress protein [Heyndrickxia vini]QQZ08925.1 universal stress protein [Heyndrickxia vini]